MFGNQTGFRRRASAGDYDLSVAGLVVCDGMVWSDLPALRGVAGHWKGRGVPNLGGGHDVHDALGRPIGIASIRCAHG